MESPPSRSRYRAVNRQTTKGAIRGGVDGGDRLQILNDALLRFFNNHAACSHRPSQFFMAKGLPGFSFHIRFQRSFCCLPRQTSGIGFSTGLRYVLRVRTLTVVLTGSRSSRVLLQIEPSTELNWVNCYSAPLQCSRLSVSRPKFSTLKPHRRVTQII